MKSATELLAEMLAIYAEPDKGAADLYLWLHQAADEIKGVVERGDSGLTLIEGALIAGARLAWSDEECCFIMIGAEEPGSINKSHSISELVQYFGEIDRARGEGE
jgi:hypothetical protein